jgi:amidophosphoribosyltransferase
MHEKPKEYCGLCAISGGVDVLERVHLGLHTMQHRGQEAAGVMVSFADGECRLHKASGLVGQVFSKLPAEWPVHDVRRAISHVRYGTAGGSTATNAQPLMVNIAGHTVGIAHNGTICNAHSLREELLHEGAIFQTSTDTELVLHLMSRASKECDGDLWKALEMALCRLKGAVRLPAPGHRRFRRWWLHRGQRDHRVQRDRGDLRAGSGAGRAGDLGCWQPHG